MNAHTSLADALARMPRAALIDAPTPIQPLKRIAEVMGPALNGVIQATYQALVGSAR